MLKSLLDRLVQAALSDKTRPRKVQSALFGFIVVPVLLVAIISSMQTYKDLTKGVLARREAFASLAAATLKERIDRLMDVGLSLATRVRFRQLVAQGRWEEASQILQDIPREFPAVERILLADLGGTLRADVPAIPSVRGQNFSYRDWYKGVSQEWKPYLSEAYRRMAEPRYNVVAAAIPIRGEDGAPTGILVLQIKLDTFLQWSKEVDMEGGAFLYITDRLGRVVSHPHLPPHGEVLDFSGVAPVQRALRGERGILISQDPVGMEQQVGAYVPIPGYGWAVVVQQAAGTTFAVRNRTLATMAAFYGAVVVLSVLLASVILSMIDRLKRVSNQLELANKELEAFSYSVSHDLRAPLRSMDGFSQALLEDYADKVDAEGKDYLQRIRGAAQRMGDLIEALLALSRVTRSEVHRAPLDLSALAGAIAAELQQREPGRQAEWVIQDGLATEGDARLLRAVLENLLGNAWKFTAARAPARIEFGVWAGSDGRPTYFVRDNGAGFDMAYEDKLFGAFQRLHTQAEYAGTGIGLATVQRIIHRHGGRVWAEGAPGKGATFYFTIGP
jgi:signal transduction histidine kinase